VWGLHLNDSPSFDRWKAGFLKAVQGWLAIVSMALHLLIDGKLKSPVHVGALFTHVSMALHLLIDGKVAAKFSPIWPSVSQWLSIF